MATDGSEHEREWLAMDQAFVTVTLDAGVFHWLHSILEAKHRIRRYDGWIPWQQKLEDRAWEQFQSAVREANASNGEVSDDAPVRVIRRRVGKKG